MRPMAMKTLIPALIPLTIGFLGLSSAYAQSSTEPPLGAPPSGEPTAAEIAAAAEEPAPKAKQRDSGIAVHLSIGGRYVAVSPDVGTSNQSTAFTGSLFAGYKIDRFFVGLGFSIGHIGNSTRYLGGTLGESSGSVGSTSFLLGPGVEIAALRSKDRRVELYGTLRFGFGKTVFSETHEPTLPDNYMSDRDETNFALNYQVGPGLRFWAHPQFAFTASSGLNGDHLFFAQNNPSGRRSDRVHSLSFYGTFGALGVF